jgi:GNAT superfamily N-acetyltransferase
VYSSGVAQFERTRGQYRLSTDPERIDVAAAHAFLSRSYWAEGIPREVVERSIANSLCFAIFDGDRQVGFARVVTDRATFAYLCDVYVLEECRGRGLGTWLVEQVCAHPDLQGLRRFVLVTRDAHPLYARLGFQAIANPAGFMEIVVPGIYKRAPG